jgi:hypothetical protein
VAARESDVVDSRIGCQAHGGDTEGDKNGGTFFKPGTTDLIFVCFYNEIENCPPLVPLDENIPVEN